MATQEESENHSVSQAESGYSFSPPPAWNNFFFICLLASGGSFSGLILRAGLFQWQGNEIHLYFSLSFMFYDSGREYIAEHFHILTIRSLACICDARQLLSPPTCRTSPRSQTESPPSWNPNCAPSPLPAAGSPAPYPHKLDRSGLCKWGQAVFVLSCLARFM